MTRSRTAGEPHVAEGSRATPLAEQGASNPPHALQPDTAEQSNFGERLRRLRDLAGLTQEEAARRIGVNRSAFAQWERGYTEPSLDRISELSELFRTSPAYLAFGLQYTTPKDRIGYVSIDYYRDNGGSNPDRPPLIIPNDFVHRFVNEEAEYATLAVESVVSNRFVRDGDHVLIDLTQAQVHRPGMYAWLLPNTTCVGYLVCVPGEGLFGIVCVNGVEHTVQMGRLSILGKIVATLAVLQ
ncbi:helix-turn-helix domain-containing protein [Methylobacterium nigriterrae]|uniref:helix-turn-helix domain-containing protein n=1 Tax=Methylobacterium nigriterrae TaxID=3127512 RepID=UPI003013B45A